MKNIVFLEIRLKHVSQAILSTSSCLHNKKRVFEVSQRLKSPTSARDGISDHDVLKIRSRLSWAAERGYHDLLLKLYEKGFPRFPVCGRLGKEWTALHWAVACGHALVLWWILATTSLSVLGQTPEQH